MDINKEISKKIALYGNRGNIGHTIKLYIALASSAHMQVRLHSERVALLAEETALQMKKDPKAAFLGGILHDIGKLSLPSELFTDDVVITFEQYGLIKSHAVKGFEILKKMHPFSALCAGLHHAVYDKGYGITTKEIPKILGMKTVKDALEIATIISVCDFIDAATHRKTHVMDHSKDDSKSLEKMLKEKYPQDSLLISTALITKEELGI